MCISISFPALVRFAELGNSATVSLCSKTVSDGVLDIQGNKNDDLNW